MSMETYFGHIEKVEDALLIFEACRIGIMHRVQRRMTEQERINLRSGSVFVWDEEESGMRRWTDGRAWSPSRVSGSFLTYRELDTRKPVSPLGTDTVDSYRNQGLVKQSLSLTTTQNRKLHLISYYNKDHVAKNQLPLPRLDKRLAAIIIPKNLYPTLQPTDPTPVSLYYTADCSESTNSPPSRQQHQHYSALNSAAQSSGSISKSSKNFFIPNPANIPPHMHSSRMHPFQKRPSPQRSLVNPAPRPSTPPGMILSHKKSLPAPSGQASAARQAARGRSHSEDQRQLDELKKHMNF